jgi:hypothetical protein
MARCEKLHSATMQESISSLQAENQPPDTQASVPAPQQPISHPLQFPLPPVPTTMSQGEPLCELPLPLLTAHLALAIEGTLQQLLVTMQALVEQVQRVNDRLDAFVAPQPLQGSRTVEGGGDNDANEELANVLERARPRRAIRDMQQV